MHTLSLDSGRECSPDFGSGHRPRESHHQSPIISEKRAQRGSTVSQGSRVEVAVIAFDKVAHRQTLTSKSVEHLPSRQLNLGHRLDNFAVNIICKSRRVTASAGEDVDC